MQKTIHIKTSEASKVVKRLEELIKEHYHIESVNEIGGEVIVMVHKIHVGSF